VKPVIDNLILYTPDRLDLIRLFRETTLSTPRPIKKPKATKRKPKPAVLTQKALDALANADPKTREFLKGILKL